MGGGKRMYEAFTLKRDKSERGSRSKTYLERDIGGDKNVDADVELPATN